LKNPKEYTNTHLDFDFQGLLDGLQLNDALLLLMHLLDDVLELHRHLLVALVADAQLLGHLLVVGGHHRELLLQLGLDGDEVDVDGLFVIIMNRISFLLQDTK